MDSRSKIQIFFIIFTGSEYAENGIPNDFKNGRSQSGLKNKKFRYRRGLNSIIPIPRLVQKSRSRPIQLYEHDGLSMHSSASVSPAAYSYSAGESDDNGADDQKGGGTSSQFDVSNRSSPFSTASGVATAPSVSTVTATPRRQLTAEQLLLSGQQLLHQGTQKQQLSPNSRHLGSSASKRFRTHLTPIQLFVRFFTYESFIFGAV